MNDPLQVALIAAIAGIISSAVTALIAPRMNWGIEEQKRKLEARRKLVEAWEKMLNDCFIENRQLPLIVCLNNYDDFSRLFARISDQEHLKRLLNDRDPQVAEDGVRQYLRDEIARIEKEWKLI